MRYTRRSGSATGCAVVLLCLTGMEGCSIVLHLPTLPEARGWLRSATESTPNSGTSTDSGVSTPDNSGGGGGTMQKSIGGGTSDGRALDLYLTGIAWRSPAPLATRPSIPSKRIRWRSGGSNGGITGGKRVTYRGADGCTMVVHPTLAFGRLGDRCVAKNARGQFAAEDFAPELAMERYWNTKFVDFESHPSDGSLNQVTSFKTGMEIEESGDADEGVIGKKWVLKAAVWQPRSLGVTEMYTLDLVDEVSVTLRYPATAGSTYDRSAGEVIGRSTICSLQQGIPSNTLGGVIHWPLPLDILTPMPIFAEELEIACRFMTDAATWDNSRFTMTLLYGWAPATMRDIIAGLQQTRRS